MKAQWDTSKGNYRQIDASELVLKEPPVTIIATLRESDTAVLIAADSGGMETPGNIRIQFPIKLRKHSTASLAWGYTGNPTIGDDFTDWLKAYEWPPTSWRTFRDDAIRYLATLNGKQRELVELSRARPGEEDTAQVLLVGWLGRPEILELDDRGLATSYSDDQFHAVGTGKVVALIAYKALEDEPSSPLEKMERIMGVASRMTPKCDPPVHIWRVTAESITGVTVMRT